MNANNSSRTFTQGVTTSMVVFICLILPGVVAAGSSGSEELQLASLKNGDDSMRHAAYLMEHVADVPQCSEIANQVNKAVANMNFSGGSRQRIENIANQIETTNCVCSTPPRI